MLTIFSSHVSYVYRGLPAYRTTFFHTASVFKHKLMKPTPSQPVPSKRGLEFLNSDIKYTVSYTSLVGLGIPKGSTSFSHEPSSKLSHFKN